MKPRVPSLRHHKPSGQAVVTLGGRDYYCGKHGTPQARAEYDRLIAEWLAAGRSVPARAASGPTVVEVLAAYLAHAQKRYRGPENDLKNIRDAVRPLKRLYGHTDAATFGPVALRAVRDDMIGSGLARTTINARVNRIRRVWKWAAGHELVPVAVHAALATVEGLRVGASDAPEPDPVGPVEVEDVMKTLEHLSRIVGAMVRIQLLSGCRCGEVMAMRGRELDLEAGEYRPGSHKNAWRGSKHRRVIALGPRAVEVIRPLLKPDPNAYLFSPRDVVEAIRQEGMGGRPARTVAERYDRRTYRQAIVRAARRAGVAPWSPLQLRHTAATMIRERYDLEAAQAVLGHARPDTTTRYAERDLERAKRVVREVG
jgi:integrase